MSRATIAAAVAVLCVAAVSGCSGDSGSAAERADGGSSTSATTSTTTGAPTTEPATTAVPSATATPTTVPPTSAAPTATAVGPLTGRVVTIDPGHNGANGAHTAEINRTVDIGTQRKACDTTGTATDAGLSESAYNWDVAVRLRALLEADGARVVLTRPDDTGWGPCIDGRAAIGNVARSDAAVSIHADGGPDAGRGFHVILPDAVPGLTDDIAADSERLGLALRDAFAAGTGMPPADYIGRGGLDRRSDLGGLNRSDVPKVFVETGNMRNATDAALLSDPTWRQRAAEALAAGVRSYLAGT